MEASSFYKIVSKYSIRELVQVIKIVSDNPKQGLDQINLSNVPTLIENHIHAIDDFVKQLEAASLIIQEDSEIDQFFQHLQNIHPFSQTRKHQLYELLRNSKSLGIDLLEIEKMIVSANDAKTAIDRANHLLEPKRILE